MIKRTNIQTRLFFNNRCKSLNLTPNSCEVQCTETLETPVAGKKLHNLQVRQRPLVSGVVDPVDVHHFHDPVLNFTEVFFEPEELNLLSKGPKFRLGNGGTRARLSNLERLDAETEAVVQRLESTDATIVRAECEHVMRQEVQEIKNVSFLHRGHFSFSTIRKIKEKLNKENLTLTRADKGNIMVIMRTSDYRERVLRFFSENGILKVNPKFPTFVKNVWRTIKQCNMVIPEHFLSYVSPQYTTIPRLYRLIKTHKTDIPDQMPIRPVVSYTGSPTHKLAEWLAGHFRQITGFTPKYSIKNSVELANKIKNIKIPPGAVLVSFDVVNLFTNTPVGEALEIIKQHLIDSNLSDIEVIQYYRLFECCLRQNFFVFDGDCYAQEDGLSMGCPVSPLSAELVMDHMEKTKISKSCLFREHVVYYYRLAGDRKDAICKHVPVEKKSEELSLSYDELMVQNKILNLENEYLKRLLEECQESNRILRENNKLLSDKVSFKIQKSDHESYSQMLKKNVNVDKYDNTSMEKRQTQKQTTDLRPSKDKLSQSQLTEVNDSRMKEHNQTTISDESKQNNNTEHENTGRNSSNSEIPWRTIKPKRPKIIGTATNNENQTTFQGRTRL
ncbi:uncharacterized protein LOC123313087 [Coccinella septempunctata]|uniref:uncharacterized protein LOC123313087 n=1 Tax=Coccinella septempunctata TaxID=41139 RepID=UPI001D08B97B|nr:uncharacterized protein LOC123313087 [Coccinella septempunctata]